MKSTFTVVLLSIAHLATASPVEVSPLPSPTTFVQNQSRTALKHRRPPILYTVIIATVPQFIALNRELPDNVTNASVRSSNAPISPTERQVYTVDGDLWRVAMEANDDEYHLEICARGAGRRANRIIVEIPPDPAYRETRRKLLSLLSGTYTFQPGTTRNLTTPIAIRVTGYPFFDGHHWTRRGLRGNNHGTDTVATLWEVHPVWKITAAQ